MNITKLLAGAVVAGSLFAAGCVVRAPAPEMEVGVGVDQPAPQADVMVAAPGPEFDFWFPGWWGWEGGRWFWHGGYWGHRPHAGAEWVPHSWARGPHGGWVHSGGHWR